MLDSFVDTSGSSSVPRQRTYRAYTLTSEGGLCSAEILNVESDAEALEFASTIQSPHGIELWERGRFLGRFAPRG